MFILHNHPTIAIMETYETLSLAINGLKKRGYTEDLNLNPHHLSTANRAEILHPEAFQIDEVFRFEGMTDPGDQSILYAISSEEFGIKGLLVNAYGIYSESMSNEMALKFQSWQGAPGK